LPPNHRYRKNRKDFFVGRVEKDVAPPRLSGEELLDVVSEYLPVHLPFEVKVGGPVQYIWMYPFERLDITVAM
jgi:hypothetical protein